MIIWVQVEPFNLPEYFDFAHFSVRPEPLRNLFLDHSSLVVPFLAHSDHVEHEYGQSKPTQLSKVADEWVRRFVAEEGESSTSTGTTDPTFPNTAVADLSMGWAIPKRTIRKLSNTQKNCLNQLFDEGERIKVKVSGKYDERCI